MTKTYITLVVAFCGLGCDSNTSQSVKDQAAAEERTPLFFEESALRGVSFRVNSDLGEGALMPEIMLGGGAAFDFDDEVFRSRESAVGKSRRFNGENFGVAV